MPYTNLWDEFTPTDNDLASSIDDLFRSLKVDLRERMNEIVVDWAADPVVLKQDIIGTRVGKKLLVHGVAFVFSPTESGVDYTNDGVVQDSSAEPARAALYLPPGVTITKIRWLMTNGDTAEMHLKLMSTSFETGFSTVDENSINAPVSGTTITDSGDIAVVIQDSKAYFLTCGKTSGSQFTVHAVEVTYNTPDVRSTI